MECDVIQWYILRVWYDGAKNVFVYIIVVLCRIIWCSVERTDIQQLFFLLGLFIQDSMSYVTGWPESDTLADRLARKNLRVQEVWNKNIVAHFDLPWFGVLDDSFQEWINQYTWPEWMFVPNKLHNFGNEYHKIACAEEVVIIYILDTTYFISLPLRENSSIVEWHILWANNLIRVFITSLAQWTALIFHAGTEYTAIYRLYWYLCRRCIIWSWMVIVMYHKASGVIKTTGNIGKSPSSSILREVWDEPIIFHRYMIRSVFRHLPSEGESKNIGM